MTLVKEMSENPMNTQSSLVEMGESARRTTVFSAPPIWPLWDSGQKVATPEKKDSDHKEKDYVV
jgi:hypothetical protein